MSTSYRKQLLAGVTSLVGAFSLISPAHALDIDARINYTAPLSKKLAAAAGDQDMSGAAGGIMTEMEAKAKTELHTPAYVTYNGGAPAGQVAGKWWFGVMVPPMAIAQTTNITGCVIGAGPGETTFTGKDLVKFTITPEGSVAVEPFAAGETCKGLLKAARDAMTQKMATQPGQKIGESSSDGRIKPAAAPAPITGPRSEAPVEGATGLAANMRSGVTGMR